MDLSQNTAGDSIEPTTDKPEERASAAPAAPPDATATPPDAAPPHDAAPPPDATAPPERPGQPAGLLAQARLTVAAARRLVTSHIDLAKAEFSEIADRAKAAAALIGIAVALVFFVAMLVPVGTTLFMGEWLFGSIGWGVLHGTLGSLALVVILVLGALEIPGRRLGTAFVAALAIGIVVAVVLGLAWPNQLFARLGDSIIPGVDAANRPLVAGVALVAIIAGVLGLLVGARFGGAAGALGGLIGAAVVGALLGAFLAISFSLRVGIALGICAAFIAWPAFAATALRSFDPSLLKARYWPGATIETTKETIEWVRARTPLGRKP